MYDLIVIGGTAQGLSAAVLATEAQVPRIRVIEQTDAVVYPELIGKHSLEVGFGESVKGIRLVADSLAVVTDRDEYETRACIVASRSFGDPAQLPEGIHANSRIHVSNIPEEVQDQDILVVGSDDRAVVLASHFVKAGARTVVLSAGTMNPDALSDASQRVMKELEHERVLTALFRSTPDEIECDDDGAMVHFDRRTPDLEFDHVVYASATTPVHPDRLGIDEDALHSGRLLYTCDYGTRTDVPGAPHRVVVQRLSQYFSAADAEVIESRNIRKPYYSSAPEDLAEDTYNATITHFEPTHSDLWVLRVKPDRGSIDHRPGQYSSLGLGYWEPRIDDAMESDIDEKWDKLVRRSYSISNRIFTDEGYLAHETEGGVLEFYIVLVPPTPTNVPGLTPRLALKRPGDRIFLGGKVTGHYTLDAVTSPDTPVIFLSTGTGEAPHNSMIVELLRNGHRGKIISAVNVRQWADLGYLEEHRRLQELYPNYTYLPLPTREANVPKRYMQDLITGGEIEEILGERLNPDTMHVYMCGNPSMVGAPDKKTGELPSEVGVVGLLLERGFAIDERKHPGNIHFENYW